MKLLFALLPVFVAFQLSVAAQDLRDLVEGAGEEVASNKLIKPGVEIFGFKLGATEEEVVAALGKPKGYFRLDGKNTAAVFENNKAYIFTEGYLSGIRIADSLFDHHLVRQFRKNSSYVRNNWRFDNGITPEMSLVEVRKILGDRLMQKDGHGSKYHQFYEEKGSVINLYFAHHMNGEDGDEAYRITGVMILRKTE